MGRFVYHERTKEQWSKRENQSASKYSGFIKDDYSTFSPKKENDIRILPPTWNNPNHYGMDLWVHYSVGPENGSVICLFKMKNRPCPICEEYNKAEATGREDAGSLKPVRRVVVWLLDRRAENKETKPLIWAMPWTCDRDISKICRDRQSGELYQIDHPEVGRDVFFDKEGEGIGTRYTGFQLSQRSSPVDDKVLEHIANNPVPETFQWRDYDEIKALFEGQAVVDDKSSEPSSRVHAEEQPEVAELCSKTIKMRGQLLGCVLAEGHEGECEFDREAEAPPTPAPTGTFERKAEAQPTSQSRAAALRQRFTTGK